MTERKPDVTPVVGSTDRGAGVADARGRLLWVDDTFCAVLDRSRAGLLGAGIVEVLALDPAEMAGAVIGGSLVRVPAERNASAQRVSALIGPAGWPWAFVVEVATSGAEAIAVPGTSLAVFALDGEGSLAALWGASEALLGFGPAALGRRVRGPADGEALFADLVDRAMVGEAATGAIIGGASFRELYLFPAEGRDGRSGALGVATTIATRPDAAHPLPLDRQRALTNLARAALGGLESGALVEEATRLVHSALDTRACAIFEYLPDRRGLLLRAEVDWPASAPGVIPATGWAYPTGAGDAEAGSLVTPIGGSPPFGCLALRLADGRGLTTDEGQFVAEAADIVAVALRRLTADGRQRHAALHDPLTGLPNRALILDHLRLALARSLRQPSPVAVLFVDLGRFKLVNDTLGHEAGDELLTAVAQRLIGALRPSDTLGRLGGDEFMVVCEGLAGEADAVGVAQRLASAFDAPFPLSRFEVSATASIGVALSNAAATDPAVVLAEADAAMYRAKERGGTSVALFDEKMRPGPALLETPQATDAASSENRLDELVSRLAGLLDDVNGTGPIDLRERPAD